MRIKESESCLEKQAGTNIQTLSQGHLEAFEEFYKREWHAQFCGLERAS